VKKGKEKIQVSGCKEINGDRLLFKSKKESADQKQIIFIIIWDKFGIFTSFIQ